MLVQVVSWPLLLAAGEWNLTLGVLHWYAGAGGPYRLSSNPSTSTSSFTDHQPSLLDRKTHSSAAFPPFFIEAQVPFWAWDAIQALELEQADNDLDSDHEFKPTSSHEDPTPPSEAQCFDSPPPKSWPPGTSAEQMGEEVPQVQDKMCC